MLVSRVIGDCPSCRGVNIFGNVSVGRQSVLRGCLKCKYSVTIPLPSIKKKILYLDQFFYSRAFTLRDKRHDSKYEEAISNIKNLANQQLIVTPFSSIHADESFQWQGKDGKTDKDLMDFIKIASLGHELEPAYDVQRNQILQSFQHFKNGKGPACLLDSSVAFDRDIHRWSDYLWIDVGGYFRDAEAVRALKTEAIRRLLLVFQKWRNSENTFQQHIDMEYQTAAEGYVLQFFDYINRITNSDPYASMNASLSSMVVEQMFYSFSKEIDYDVRMKFIVDFFRSDHFKLTPYQWISVRIFALLQEGVRRGDYKNNGKSERRLQGIFQDIDHIATYAPYCDAIFIDKAMAALLRDKRINPRKHFDTIVFSEDNWDEFTTWLSSLSKQMSSAHLEALELAYPTPKVKLSYKFNGKPNAK